MNNFQFSLHFTVLALGIMLASITGCQGGGDDTQQSSPDSNSSDEQDTLTDSEIAGTDDVQTKQDIPSMVQKAILNMHEGMCSNEEEVRLQTLHRYMPKESHFVKLFGDDRGRLAWSVHKNLVAEMRRNTDKIKAEMESHGKVVGVKVTDVRKNHFEAKAYKELLAMIPKNISIYRASTRTEKGSSASGDYVVFDDQVIFIRGLSAVPDFFALEPSERDRILREIERRSEE